MKESERKPFSGARTTLACGFLILIFVVSLAPPAHSDNVEDQVKLLFESYFALFNAEDPESLANQIFEPPVQFSNGKRHGIWNSESDVARGFVEALAALRAQGWDKSVISNIYTCVLAENYALVELSYSRLDVNGEVIPPRKRKGVYVVLRTDDGWRIIADYAQQPSVQISCSS